MHAPSQTYTFDNFRFDADRLALYHENILVKAGNKKTMQVLSVLLTRPNNLITHDEIIEKVWRDNPHGVTPGHIGQYISRLRKIFAEYAPEKRYVETVKGRGYSFAGDVLLGEVGESEIAAALGSAPSDKDFARTEFGEKPKTATARQFVFRRSALVFSVMIVAFLIAFAAWTRLSKNDEEEIRKTVKESQLYESLVLYKNPASFDETQLDKYWTAETDASSNTDRNRIRQAVKKLVDEGRRYGDETKCEQFEFQSIEINAERNFAVVKTLEKWFIAAYLSDGNLHKNKTVGPYFVSYLVRKVDGRWLIEKSNTARVNRPTPRLSDVEIASEVKSGEQFFIRLTGQDFEKETVVVEIFGDGCPESKPCKISNFALRENAKMTETALDNIPLTLGSGEFRIIVRNGDSPQSNPVQLKVP